MQSQNRAERLRCALLPAHRDNSSLRTVKLSADDPTAWQPAFERWILSHCVFRDRCAGGIACLHLHFAAWCIQHSDVCPCTRPTFELLLACEGFELADGLVRGVILKEDAGIRRLG